MAQAGGWRVTGRRAAAPPLPHVLPPARLHVAGPMLVLWGLAIATSPLAGFGAGQPQVMHGLIALAFLLMLPGFLVPVRGDRTVALVAFALLVDVFLVNAGNWLAGPRDSKFLMSVAYYGFNLLVMLAVCSLALTARTGLERALRLGIVAGLVLEFAILITGAGQGGRVSGSFDNPNRLAYWAISMSSCWMAMLRPGEPLRLQDALVTGGAVVLCIMSSSRAGALGAAVLLVLALLRIKVRAVMIPLALTVAISGAIVAAATFETWTDFLLDQTVVDRFGVEKKHDSFAGRGYDRIWLFPQHVLLGAGEGGFERFEAVSAGGDNEIHSSYATMLFGYGLPGTLLFGWLLWLIYRGAGWYYVALSAPMGLYGVAHQGWRQSIVWIFFGLVLAARMRSAKERKDIAHR